MATSLAYLTTVQKILTRYGMSTYVAFGNFGNLLVITVFIQSEQRRSACSLYLLTMTIFNIYCVNVGVIPIIYALDHYNITSATLLGCQMQFYFRHVFFQMLRTAKALACLDRILVVKNLRSLRRRIQPEKRDDEEIQRPIRKIRKRDRDLIKMIFIEVIFYIITTLPFSLYLVYKLITDPFVKSQQRKQIESFITYMLQSFMLYFNTAVPFYIYVATSPAFRKELKTVFIKLYASATGKQMIDEHHARATTFTARA